MADEWYCLISGEESGPISGQELKAMVARGELLPDDSLRRGEGGAWVPARRIKGLFPAEEESGSNAAIETDSPSKAGAKPKRLLRAKAVGGEESDSSVAPVKAEPAGKRPPPAPARAARPASKSPPPAPAGRPKRPSEPGQEQGVAAGAGEFGFLEDAYSTSPSSSTATKTAHSHAAAKRKLDPKFVVVLLVLSVVLLVLTVVLFIAKQSGDKPKNDKEGKPAAEAKGEAGKEDKGDAADSDKTSAKKKDGGKDAWRDSSKPVKVGEMTVQLASISIGKARTEGAQTKDDCLMIRVKLTNGSDAKKDYVSWNVLGTAGVSLVDQTSKPYAMIGGKTAFDGQLTRASIGPGESVEDLLLFETPAKKATYVRLRLPKSALPFAKEKGSLDFQIEMSKVGAGSDKPAEKAAPEKPAADNPATEKAADKAAPEKAATKAAPEKAADKPAPAAAPEKPASAPLTPPTMDSFSAPLTPPALPSAVAPVAPVAVGKAAAADRPKPSREDPDIPALEINAKDGENLPPRL